MRSLLLPLSCVLAGFLLGHFLRPGGAPAPRPGPAPPVDSPSRGGQPPSALPVGAPAAREDPLPDPPDTPDCFAEVLRGERSAGTAPAPPPAPEPTPYRDLAALLSGDPGRCRDDEYRQAVRRRIREGGPGSITPAETRALRRRGEGWAADESVAGWSDADLVRVLDALSRSRDPGENEWMDSLPEILDRLTSRTGAVVPPEVADRLLGHDDVRLRKTAVLALLRTAPPDPERVARLAAGDPSPEVRRFAVVSLAGMAEEGRLEPAVATPVVFRGLRDPDWAVRACALDAFRALGPAAADEALRVLSTPGFVEAAEFPAVASLLRVVLDAGRVGDLPDADWTPGLAAAAAPEIADWLRDRPDRWAPVRERALAILRALPDGAAEEAGELCCLAAEHGDLVPSFEVLGSRSRPVGFRLAGFAGLRWAAPEEVCVRTALEVVGNAAESPRLRIEVIRAAEAFDLDRADLRTAWRRALERAAAEDPNEWVRYAAAEALRLLPPAGD